MDGTATRVGSILHSAFQHPNTGGFSFKIRSSSVFQQLQNDTHTKKSHPNKPNQERAVVGFLFPFKICKHVCSVLVEMSNLKQRELVHHLSKLQLALAAPCDIIREQHGKGEKTNPGAQPSNRRK